MKKVIAMSLSLVVAGTVCIAKTSKKQTTTNKKTLIYKTAGNVRLTMDIYYPLKFDPVKSNKKLPAVVFFFGGGWVGGTKGHFRRQGQYLAKRGMIAICPQYRTKKSHKVTPDKCLQDAKSAMRYVYANAAKLGIDKKRILAGGGSAGGHLAAAVTFCEKFNAPDDDLKVECKPKALILFNPVIDNSDKGYGHDRVKKYWKDFSPMHNIGKNPPPTLFLLGDHDKLVPVATAENYKAIMETNGGRCDLIIYKGAGHGFFNYTKRGKKSPFYSKTIKAMDKFLISLGYLQSAK
jgi:acetyl esterase/lipase